MKVVLDTNVLVADFFMTRNAFKVLRSSPRHRIKIMLPSVVIEETVTKYGETVQKHLSEIDSALKRLDGLRATEGVDRPNVLLEGVSQSFREFLMDQVKRMRVDVLETPTITHDEIVRRLLERRRPFNQQGEGYRDTLIWEAVLGCLHHNSKVAFVSNNWRDFASSKDGTQLAEDLLNDVEERGYLKNSILLYPTLDAFVSAQIEPAISALGEIKKLYGRGGSTKLHEELVRQLHTLLPKGQEAEVSEYGDAVMEHVTIQKIDTAKLHDWMSVQDVWPLDEGANKFAVTIYVGIEATLNALIFVQASHRLDEEPSFKMLDPEWNPAYTLVEITRPLGVFIEGTFDFNQRTLSDVELAEARVERE